ncbi:MAG: GH92 family glycosyl hydrolase [Verrucomicrobiota bacterium]
MNPPIMFHANFRLIAGSLLAFLLLGDPSIRASEPSVTTGTNLTGLVCPLAGTDNGNLTPGAVAPWGQVWLSPDTTAEHAPNGYRSWSPILGFSHTHVSGTGGGSGYGNVRVTPQCGALTLPVTASAKRDETARAGYYAVTLQDGAVRAELTASPRVGHHRYTFASGGPAYLLIDAACQLSTYAKDLPKSLATNSAVKIVSDRRIEGYGAFGRGELWGGGPHKVFFAAEFDQPFVQAGVWKNETPLAGVKEADGGRVGAYAKFNPAPGGSVGLRVGISFKSLENARAALGADPQTFDQARDTATATWKHLLSAISIDGGTDEQRKLFYTCLYRSLTMPTDITGDNPLWDSTEPHFWHYFCIWDSFRSVNPLLMLIAPDRQRDMLRCLLDIFEHLGWLPDAWISGNYGPVQGGSNADILFADAYVKGLTGIDYAKALKAMRKNAETQSDNARIHGRYDATGYASRGYLADEVPQSASRALDYAYDDYCICELARGLGDLATAAAYAKRAQFVFNLFNPETKAFWTRSATGAWTPGFGLDVVGNPSWAGLRFSEGSSREYGFYVPHDMAGLIRRHGGAMPFLTLLDDCFDGGHVPLDNEPYFLTPYAYNYVGRPDRTAERVRTLLATRWGLQAKGWPGQDDSGAMSSWYVFSALGFFPVAGQDLYLIGSPIFPRATIRLGNSGKTLVIRADQTSTENKYIQSATLNGKSWDKDWFRHSDIAHGGELILEMGSNPSGWGSRGELPPSMSRAGKPEK